MAKLIGTVTHVVGEVFAVSADGTRRALFEGDKLFAGEQLQTGAAGAVAVHLADGGELTLGRDSNMPLTDQILANHATHIDTPDTKGPTQAQLTDVEQIQKAIAAGDDPTKTADPTAAGPAATGVPGALGGGHSFVLLSEVGGHVDPVIGFPTAGFSTGGILPDDQVAPFTTTDDSTPRDTSITISGLDVSGGEETVNEANLPDGSAANAGALTQSGSFTITAADGLQSLSVGGVNVISGGVPSGFPQTITTSLGNTLTITGYNPQTGEVTYNYTLNGADTHPNGNGTNDLVDHLPVVATNNDGNTATGTIDVNIIDDVPRAVNDNNGTATETHVTLTGNVLTNDIQGADRIPTGPIVGGTFVGTYGTLVLAADGTYTYTLNPHDPDFIALHGGGNGTDVFTYTLKDADGDTSQATLTLQIHNNDDPVVIGGLNGDGADATVYEANLPTGSVHNGVVSQSGTFTVTANDGLQTLSVGGINVVVGGNASGFPQSITTELGNTLTITGYNAETGVVSYTYTLNGADQHPNGDGNNSLGEHFNVVATDSDGSTANATLNVNVVDDVPKAVDDTNAHTSSETMLSLTGNVLTNDTQGADRIPTGPIVGGTFVGTYGTLVLAADGTYTYTLNTHDPDFIALHGGGNGTDVFTYTLKDADGDTSQANLTVQVHNNDDPVLITGLNVEGGEVTVYEKNLPDGSVHNGVVSQSGTFTVTANDGLQTLSVGGINVVVGGTASGFPQSITTELGNTLTITGYNAETGVVSYTYTLNGADQHPNGDGANSLAEHFNVVATDTDGSTANGSLDVNVVDDVPKANNDANPYHASESNPVLMGNVLENDVQGADRVPTGPTGTTGPITGGTFQGLYGTLVLETDGSYTYTVNPHDPDFIALHGGGNGTEVFTYTLRDADGDTSTATLTLQIHNNDDGVTIQCLDVKGGELTVFEKNLPDGSHPNAGALTQHGVFTVHAEDGLASLKVGGIDVVLNGHAAGFPQSINTALGTLTITGYNEANGEVSYQYTLNHPDNHPDGTTEHFSVVATDTDGDHTSASLDVNIVDDTPKAHNDANPYQATETNPVLQGNLLINDVQGADRVPTGPTGTTGPIIGGTFEGKYGTLVLETDGSYTYTVNPHDPDFIALHGGGNGTEVFTYTLTDADGDTSKATLTLQIHNNDDGVTIDCLDAKGGELTVQEANLPDGSHPNAGALTQSGVFTVHANDGLASLNVGGVNGVGGINVVLNGHTAGFPQSISTALGTLTITGYNEANGEVSYQYTLNHPDNHPDGTTEHFNVVATDTDGDHSSASLDVNIVDDTPHAYNDANPYQATETNPVLQGNLLINDVQGADRVVTGPTGTTGPITGGTFEGKYGTLVLETDGSYTYTVNPHDPDFIALHGGGNGTEVFTYTLNDADGDTSKATLTLQIHNNDDGVTIDCLDVKGGELTVQEANLANGSHPDANALTQSGVFTVHAADGLASLNIGSVNGVGGINVVLGGVTAGFPQSTTTPLGTLTITGYNASTGEVHYSYTLNHPDNHPDGITEHFNVVATDTDGSHASASIDVNVVDDAPKVVDSDRTSPTVGVNTNLLLVIDVSGSMGDLVAPGQTRLDLEKTALSALLDKYEAMGDVKVQIVTFSTGAHDATPVWVDIDTAKSIIDHLQAGGDTNYDAAVAAAKAAFPTAGAIAGGQNVAYFLSDGEPTNNQNIGSSDEAAWKDFLNAHDIKAYAIGVGAGSNSNYLDPLAYDGTTSTNTNSVIVTNPNNLDAVLTGTVQGVPITGSLMTNGTFGADGGFIKALVVDGVSYLYDPKANSGQGGFSVVGGASHGTFDTTTNSITVTSHNGGTLVVDMDNGEYTYTPPKVGSSGVTETFGFVASDNDGDAAGANLVVHVNPNAPPVAVADNVITNILAPNITVPAELLVANDTDPNGDKLSASPTSFPTGWVAKGGDFTAAALKTINFTGTSNIDANQLKTLDRSDFFNSSALTALVVLNGYLGATNASAANAQDLYSVTLHKGESVTLDNNKGDSHLTMQWQDTNGVFHNIADGSTFTATQDGVYHIHVSNIPDTGTHSQAAETYQLNMAVNYAGAQDVTPDVHSSYTATDGHGGSSAANVAISYQGGDTIQGTNGDDILIGGNGNLHLHGGDGNDVLQAGTGNNELFGDNGNDLIYSGPGNDTIDGGAGNNTVSYEHATAGVHVDLSIITAQNTLGAGTDTLTNIDNVIGSHFNDTIIGGSDNNILSGGLGNDILNGGGGDDILIGGPGNNTLTGGAGNDTFKWEQGNTGHDLVTDFTLGSDKLDLSQLLQGENSSSASLDDYLHFKVTGTGANVVTTIDVSSTAGAAPTQTIDLAGVDLASHYGVSPGAGGVVAGGHDTASIINGMISDHSLKVDTV
jgi:large repetitive protein